MALKERLKIEHIRTDTYIIFPEDKAYFVVRRTAENPDGEAFAMFWTKEDAEALVAALEAAPR